MFSKNADVFYNDIIIKAMASLRMYLCILTAHTTSYLGEKIKKLLKRFSQNQQKT